MNRKSSFGFTLVELLVVIAIIGILVALLLPAVNSAREAARRTQCLNQIRQLSLAALVHESAHKTYPTGGWGYFWVGDADRGFGKDQPGGWIFNLMPFVEEGNSYAACKDGDPDSLSQAQMDAARDVVTDPLTLINCPSRRPSQVYPKPTDGTFVAYNASRNPADANLAGRTDYAINAGDQDENELGPAGWPNSYARAANFRWTDNRRYSGVGFYRSEIRIRHIVDGTSKTYLIAEKYLNPATYLTGTDPGDNETWCTGFNNDNYRVAYAEPLHDRFGYRDWKRMGSVHASGFNVSMCDSSVQHITYDIDLDTHRKFANRRNAKDRPTGPVR